MPLHALSDDERRSHCRREIEALELWLRRLVHDTFSDAYGAAYLDAKGDDGNQLFNAEMSRNIAARRIKDPSRDSRPINATTLDELVKVICKTQTYNQHFRDALRVAFPEGNQEARTFLDRVVEIRNNLSHANPITVHDAARAICYTQDVIASCKEHYASMNMQKEYNVPMIIKVSDTLGNIHQRAGDDDRICKFNKDGSRRLYPGDRLTIEVEVDPTFDRSSYRVEWSWHSNGRQELRDADRFTIDIDNSHVGEEFEITCALVTNRDWHRRRHWDELVFLSYKILPPSM